jgi:peptidoglycan/xylan/chitin deacetylase (PgdA/CDA1 family)
MLRTTNTARAAAVVVGVGALVHLLPGLVGWRWARVRALPRLSGIGHPDHVALTFDDGPDPTSTPAILDTLDVLGWKATFFCLGVQARRSPGLVAEIVARGHEPAVHGDTHASHLLRAGPSTIADLRRARDTIEDAAGVPVRWFRPPYGAVAASTLMATRTVGMTMVLWSTLGVDWKASSTGHSVAANVERTFRPGATVLLHDSDVTAAPGSWHSTVDALPLLATRWDAAGLRVGTLGEHGLAFAV